MLSPLCPPTHLTIGPLSVILSKSLLSVKSMASSLRYTCATFFGFFCSVSLYFSQMVAVDVVPIINIPGYGDQAAVTVVDQLKIKSQNDRALLDQAKDLVYLKGFNEGVMLVGEHAGKPVSVAKPLIKKALIEVLFLCYILLLSCFFSHRNLGGSSRSIF